MLTLVVRRDRTYVGDHLRHGVLHLQAGVQLEEEEVLVVHRVQVLHRPGVAVAHLQHIRGSEDARVTTTTAAGG